MHKLSSRDLRNILGAVSILNESLDLETLPQRTTAAVTRVLPSDMVTYNEVDLVRRTDRIFVTPEDVRLAAGTPEYAAFMRHIDEHPVIAHNACVADPVPRKISDFLSNRRLRSLGLHAEFFHGFAVGREPRAGAAGGLTQREAEVLHWVAGASPMTTSHASSAQRRPR